MLFCSISMQAQTTININPIKDNTLYENATGSLSNGAGDHLFVGATNQGSKRRGLLKFDIASHVPLDATILEATLALSMDKTSSLSSNIELHTVSADWGEGASVAPEIGGGNGATAQTNDATWLHTFYNSSLWNTAGGDFNALVSATTSVNGIGSYTWTSSQLVADVQNWLNSPASNFGWCLTGDEANLRSTKRFASKEITTLNSRPLLTIVYSLSVNVQETYIDPHCTIYPNPSSGMMQLVVRGVSNAEVRKYYPIS